MMSAFHDKVAAMSLIQNKAHDSLLQKRQSLPVPPFSLAAPLHSVHLSSVVLVDLVVSWPNSSEQEEGLEAFAE